MPSLSTLTKCIRHPAETYALFTWSLRKPLYADVHARNATPSIKEAYALLTLTSRSFVAVCAELSPELHMPVVVFYLILRALDTIEDDMTLPLAKKEKLLRGFWEIAGDESWSFTESGPEEKDRDVLVKYPVIAKEFNALKEEYQVVIRNITKRMGNGMADFAVRASEGVSVRSVKDYELYCHYVAGLVGEGLTRLFVSAQVADSSLLAEKPELMESMGQLLQHVNIIRDIHEDFQSGRAFWPEEVWSKHVDSLSNLFQVENRERALQCSSEMILLALQRVEDCLRYMECIKEQSTFNFVAIPQSMAVATLELCFRNGRMFERNIKIGRGQACEVMLRSTRGFGGVCEVFGEYVRKIRGKNVVGDPSYEAVEDACRRIERFVEGVSPKRRESGLRIGALLMSGFVGALGLVAWGYLSNTAISR